MVVFKAGSCQVLGTRVHVDVLPLDLAVVIPRHRIFYTRKSSVVSNHRKDN